VARSLRSSRALAAGIVTFATFTDVVAYSIAVPVLPDLSRRLGASPTTVGLLFASFGLTLLVTSVPMGAISDRIGRRLPLLAGLVALSASTLLFAFAIELPMLFAARLAQGAADAVAWVVGLALIADLYGPEERGRAMGFMMSGSTFGFMIGPALGGWLYERGGTEVPFLVVAAMALAAAAGVAWLRLPEQSHADDPVPLRTVLRVPAVLACATAVVVGGGTIAMLEPVLSLYLSVDIGLRPSSIGFVFGLGALAAGALHPVFGRIADRHGARTLTLAGLVATGLVLPVFGLIYSFQSGLVLYGLGAIPVSMVVTPSLAYMAEATSMAGTRSFGVAYGLYNVAWALGLLVGPAFGGFVFERLGFQTLLLIWSPAVLVLTWAIVRAGRPSVRFDPRRHRALASPTAAGRERVETP